MTLLNRAQAGGKGFELQKLKVQGFSVPDFIILTQEDYQKYDQNLKSWPQFNACLSMGPLAVRSSGSMEDSSEHSFAGIFETVLNVKTAEELVKAIQTVWESSKTSLAQNYSQKSGLSLQTFRFSIVIQKFIQPDFSGVVFTADPVTGFRSHTHISATAGTGDKLVSGDVTGTTYILNEKKQVIQKSGELVISDEILRKIYSESHRAASLMKKPIDMEWAVLNNQLYILQARPITTPLGHTGSLTTSIFDNSNIQESYSGVTTPLTFTYAQEAYKQVYNQIMRLMQMSEEDFQQAQYRHTHMLGLVNGRVYYNINSWYEGLLCFPHFGRQKDDMEKMMGLKKPVDFVQSVQLSTAEKLKRLPAFAALVTRLLYKFSKIKTYVTEFTNWFEDLEKKFDPSQNQFLENEQLIRRLYDFQKQTLEKWGIPILNDFLVMMTHGSLKREIDKLGLTNEFHDCMRGAELESLKPTLLLNEIVSMIKMSKAESVLSSTDDVEFILLNLEKNHPEILRKVESFIRLYGDRSIGELKLETITYKQNPASLFNMLRELLKSDKPLHLSDTDEASLKNFMAGYRQKAGFVKSLFINRRLEKLKYAVAARELMRLHRTRVFGMNREYYLEIGQRLVDLDAIQSVRDIFFLTRQEIFDYFWGLSVTLQLQPLIDLRKHEWAEYGKQNVDQQVQVSVPNSHWMKSLRPEELTLPSSGDLKGLGCSSGTVKARIKKVTSPHEISNLQGCIMVAERTDPGWTPLFSIIAGVIIEKGSALSHSAVIAREMGIPAIVAVDNIMKILNDGDEVLMDGRTGQITIINKRIENGPREIEPPFPN